MNQPTTAPVTPFIATIFRLLNYLEIVAVVAAAVGFAMLYSSMEGAPEILMVALSTLAAVFFLRAYQPIDGPPSQIENEGDRPTGQFGLLGARVAPKVLGIGSSITTIGILFSLLELKGAMEMLSIGCVVLPIAGVLVGFFMLSKPAWAGALMPLVYRAVAVWVVGIYLFLGNPA